MFPLTSIDIDSNFCLSHHHDLVKHSQEQVMNVLQHRKDWMLHWTCYFLFYNTQQVLTSEHASRLSSPWNYLTAVVYQAAPFFHVSMPAWNLSTQNDLGLFCQSSRYLRPIGQDWELWCLFWHVILPDILDPVSSGALSTDQSVAVRYHCTYLS